MELYRRDWSLTVRKASKIFYITWNEEENQILHEIFRVVSRFPRHISCYIAESRLPLGQCKSDHWKKLFCKGFILNFAYFVVHRLCHNIFLQELGMRHNYLHKISFLLFYCLWTAYYLRFSSFVFFICCDYIFLFNLMLAGQYEII